MFQNVFGSDGKFHLENQVGNIRYDFTTGESKTVYPVGSNTNMTFDNSGVHTEVQTGNMRYRLGESGFDWIL